MKRRFRLAAAAVAVAVLVAVAAAFWWRADAPAWPSFPSDRTGQPQVIVRVARDYGHRTGDLLSADIFVRLKPGATLDVSTLSVEGDFELAAAPQVVQETLPDGALVYRLRINVQSFQVKPKVVLNATMTWVDGQTRSQLAVQPLPLYTSNTWDGRKQLQEGDDPRVPYYWYALRHILPLSLASIVFAALCALAVRNYLRHRPRRQIDFAYNRALELLGLIAQGTCTREQHLELDGIVRERLAIGPVPPAQLDASSVGAAVRELLTLNAVAIYGDRGLDEAGNARLRVVGDEVVVKLLPSSGGKAASL